MLKKLTTNTVIREKKEVIERTANICGVAMCVQTLCGGSPDVGVELRIEVQVY